jgi:uncharacterized membrane protein YkvA (DUF1232 family)
MVKRVTAHVATEQRPRTCLQTRIGRLSAGSRRRTPQSAKIFLGLAVGYLCMPFDLIPDFIPVLGHLDDIVIVPALVYLALRFIPPELVAEHKTHVTQEAEQRSASRAATPTI